jgi:hypothetical protein
MSYPINTTLLTSFVENYIRQYSSRIDQLSTQANVVNVITKDGGYFYVRGNFRVISKSDLLQQSSGILDPTRIEDLRVQLINQIQQQVPQNVWSNVTSAVSSVINQTTYVSIVQTTFDTNTLRITITGQLIVNSDAEISQNIVTRAIATNVIQSILNASNGLFYDGNPTTTPAPSPSTSSSNNTLLIVLGLLFGCVVSFIILILIFASKK